MAAIALSLRDVATNPLGHPGGRFLLAQAQALLAGTLEAALAPALQLERQAFGPAVLAASPPLAERADQEGFPSAARLLGFLRAATTLSTRAGALAQRLSGLLPDAAAAPYRAPVFLDATPSSAGGTPQENIGRLLLADTRHQARSGINQFTLRVGAAQEYALSVVLDQRDTNRDVLRKVAAAINDAQPGVRAEVQEASAGRAVVVRLRIAALRPGVAQRFELQDRVGDVVAYTGAAEVRTPPSDEQTGGTASFTAVPAPAPSRLSAETRAAVLDLARQVVAALNESVGHAEGIPLRADLALRLRDAAKSTPSLAAAGLTASTDGRLQLEDFVLERALAADATMPAAVAGLRQLATRLAQIGRELTAQPPLALVEPPAHDGGVGTAPLAPTSVAPVASLVQSYRLAQQRAEFSLAAALRSGGLVINRPV